MPKLVVHSQALGDMVNTFRRHRFLWIAIALAVVGFCCLLFWSFGSGRPDGIVVDASRLPVSVNVAGARVTLLSVKRAGWSPSEPEMSIETTIEALKRGSRVDPEYCLALIGGKKSISCASSISGPSGGFCKLGASYSYEIEKSADKADVIYSVQSYVPGNAQTIVFRDVKPSSLPVTSSSGPVSITLEKVYAVGSYHGPYHAIMTLIVEYSVEGPSDNFRAEFALQKDGHSSLQFSSAPYWLVGMTNELRDESGELIEWDGCGTDEIGGAKDLFDNEVGQRTWLESTVSRVSPSRASDMITDRSLRAAKTSKRQFRIKNNYGVDRVPKRFTIKFVFNGPPKSRKSGEVIFKNITIPPK